MFYDQAHNKLNTGGLRFEHELQDIEKLNPCAARRTQVTAISLHAYAYLPEQVCPAAERLQQVIATARWWSP